MPSQPQVETEPPGEHKGGKTDTGGTCSDQPLATSIETSVPGDSAEDTVKAPVESSQASRPPSHAGSVQNATLDKPDGSVAHTTDEEGDGDENASVTSDGSSGRDPSSSDSDDACVGVDAYSAEQLVNTVASKLDSKSIFAAYKKKLATTKRYRRATAPIPARAPRQIYRQPDPGDGQFGPLLPTMVPPPPGPVFEVGEDPETQASNLVRGVVDYLRVLEDRLERLENEKEDRRSRDSSPSPEPKSPASEAGSEEIPLGFSLAIRFYDSRSYLNQWGDLPDVHRDIKSSPWRDPGAFQRGIGVQDLVRVLYTPTTAAPSPGYQAASEPPSPADADIDIMMICIDSFDVSNFIRGSVPGVPVTFMDGKLLKVGKPFRPLLRNYARMKEHFAILDSKFGDSPRGDQIHRDEQEGTPEPNHSNPTAQQYTRLAWSHFKIVLEFLDEYLAESISLYGRLRSGAVQHVAYENLWMLFDAEDIIYAPARDATQAEYVPALGMVPGTEAVPIAASRMRQNTPQAFRVLASSGGLPTSKSLVPNRVLDGEFVPSPESAIQSDKVIRRIRDTFTEFYVSCLYIDFNGVQYGIVRELFVFRPYEDEMEIKNLQAFPVCYVQGLADSLLDRGRTFIKMTSVSHIQYEGMTTGVKREEVLLFNIPFGALVNVFLLTLGLQINSPCVVDIKLAFESDEDAGKDVIHKPAFAPPGAGPWVYSSPTESKDVYDHRMTPPQSDFCHEPWCFSRSHCVNTYNDVQRSRRDRQETALRLILEEYEAAKQQGHKGLDRFAQILEDNRLVFVLPGAVPGYALRNRKWVLLNLVHLKPVAHNNEWENLVLPDGHREMVQAMVETYTRELGSQHDAVGMDLVSGKGKGCIILLHGVPGVGKTSTAECVAAHTKKPLYPITCGDIGYRPEDVERNMEAHFRLAHKWGCVLLLDEADVFLAKRDHHDIQRNGLVSVFLRILEYYQGILFLTTNRVGTIDDAFRSRLHLTLYYPRLDRKQTIQIFKRNFKRIAEVNADRAASGLPSFVYDSAEKRVVDWVKNSWKTLRWNGRQIRNTFQTVLALAEFNAKRKGDANPVVKEKHFKIVAQAASQFDEYLKLTHGHDEDKMAKRDYYRATDYKLDSSLVYRGPEKDSEESEESESSSSSSSSSEEKSEAEKKSKKKGKGKVVAGKSKKGKDKKGKEKKKSEEEESEETD
ncbi:hypothetical protein OQA88_9298 [Cercophora sp. LCS_1]